jgi:hypothetical protein
VAKLPLSNPQILDGEGGRVLDAPAGLHGIAASNVSLARLEGERDPVQLHDGALLALIPATTWREIR